jgi:hypothetical protein
VLDASVQLDDLFLNNSFNPVVWNRLQQMDHAPENGCPRRSMSSLRVSRRLKCISSTVGCVVWGLALIRCSTMVRCRSPAVVICLFSLIDGELGAERVNIKMVSLREIVNEEQSKQ